MIFGRDLYSRDPFGRSSFGDDFSTLAPFEDLLLNRESDLIFLVNIKPWDPGAGPPAVVEHGFGGYTRPVLFKDTDRSFHNVLSRALRSRSDLFLLLGEDVRTGGTSGVVDIVIAHGELDYLADLFYDGRDVEVLLGGPGFQYFEFQPVFIGKGQKPRWTQDLFTLGVRDTSDVLQDPLQSTTYLGDEDTDPDTFEGPPDLAGAKKPRCFGECKHIEPVLVNRNKLVYQFNDGPIEAVDVVYDGAAILAAEDDPSGGPADPGAPAGSIQRIGFTSVLDWDALSDPPLDPALPVKYIYDLDTGLVRLDGLVTNPLTMSVKGDNDGPDNYVTTAAEIIKRVISIEGTLDPLLDIDLGSFAQLDIDQPGEVQFYTKDDVSILNVVDKILQTIGGYREVTRDGLLAVGVFKFRTSVATFEETINIIDLKHDESGSLLPVEYPVNKLTIGYAQSYTVMGDDVVTPIALDPDKDFVSTSHRLVVAPRDGGGDPDQTAIDATKARRLKSVDIRLDGNFVNLADAEAEVDRRYALLEADRVGYTVKVVDQRFLRMNGETITLKHSRWGLSAGKDFIILGIDEDTNTLQTTLRLWG